ncbi:hypothetical protein [Streptomyces poonensis]|uniref:Lipoprotein n=1 Tax=Streptomyces poonensis TaxID=68255 RepID=A0A918UPU1_9ACTN|nr:hypothetical protein [Streptomyces poonensis]GGZ25373.1 hypothetical protein GCM10010365_52010 [Streptomyces poonensis]GLJ89135.1 hypothetical protein GCM10017589_17350 [Streptomyces poonensis]
MASHRAHWATGAALAAAVAVGVTALSGCSDEGGGSAPSGPAASAAQSLGGAASSAASSLSSQAAGALESAKAEAGRKLDQIKGGVDAKGDVVLGDPITGSQGPATVPVTAHNSADAQKSFAVQVDFTDQDGNLLDTVVLTINDVPAGKSGEANAHSTRELTGEVRAVVHRAVRY